MYNRKDFSFNPLHIRHTTLKGKKAIAKTVMYVSYQGLKGSDFVSRYTNFKMVNPLTPRRD